MSTLRTLLRPSHVLLVLALGASGCLGPSLNAPLADAKRRVSTVRPEADFSGVRAKWWKSTADAEAARKLATEPLSFPYVREIMRAQHGLFERLGMAEPGVNPLERLIGEESPHVAAFVVPSRGQIIVRNPDISTLTHELGHIASWRLGYWEIPKPYLWLHPDQAGDPSWVDLDAFIAGWALEEGSAQVTGSAAMADPLLAIPDWGPIEARFRQAAGGMDPRVKAPLVNRVSFLAYTNGTRFVLARRQGGEDLESALENAWSSFRGTTREIAMPETESVASRLGQALRSSGSEIQPVPSGATRVGTFLLYQSLSSHNANAVEPARSIAKELEDDLMLTWDSDRHLWWTQWRDEASAAKFAAAFADVSETAAITLQGGEVLVSWRAPETNALEVLREPF